MATKRRKRSSTPVRRRRRSSVGAVGKVRRRRTRRKSSGVGAAPDFLMNALASAAGILGGALANKFIPIQNNLAKAGIKIGLAFVIPKMVKNNAMANSFAVGLATSAVLDAGKQFAPQFFSGVGDAEPVVLIQGLDDDQLNGVDEGGIPSLSGDDDYMSGPEDRLGDTLESMSGSEDQLGDAGGLQSLL